MKEKQKQKPSTTKINIIKKQKIAKEYCKYESEREGEKETEIETMRGTLCYFLLIS